MFRLHNFLAAALVLSCGLLTGCGGGAADASNLLKQGDANATLVINRPAATGGSVRADVGALNCPSDCDETYPVSTVVALTAAAAPGYTFTGWSGEGVGCGSSATCTITMTGSLTVSATFSLDAKTQRDLAVAVAGSGTVSSVPNGVTCPGDCAASFDDGATVSLTATPANGFRFSAWSGAGCSGASPTCVVTMTASRSVTASFNPLAPVTQILSVKLSGSGTVASSPAGISCPNNCAAPFTQGSTANLVAAPAAGYQFAGWTDACSGAGNCTVVMSTARSVGAIFTTVAPNTAALNLVVNGSGSVTSAPAGIDCGSVCSASFSVGSNVKLTAVPADGFAFTGWAGGGCSGASTCNVVVSTATSVSATFVQVKYTLSVSKIGSGTITSNLAGINCGAACSASYAPNSQVVLTATPSTGYAFAGWSGGACSGTGTCALTLASATSVSATFTQITYRLIVSLSGSGSVSSSPAGIACGSTCSANYAANSVVTLTAAPSSGFTFVGWSGACSGNGTCVVTLASATSVAASFTATDPGPLTVPSAGLLPILLNFAETAARNWNFGGHVVTAEFTTAQGLWNYDDSTYEPWLFDRADAWRMLYELTGNARWQSQAQADLAYYESRLGTNGYFLNKVSEQDSKYSYVHPWSSNAAKNAAAYAATVASFPSVARLTDSSIWTEREVWVALNAAVKYLGVSSDPAVFARAQAMIDQWDAVCAGRKAPLVSYAKHEGDGPTDLISSPWMSALYFQAARLYAERVPAAAAQVHKQASDYFDWINTPGNRGFYSGAEVDAQYAGLVFPAYMAGGTTFGDAAVDEGNMEHALDVAGFIAFAINSKKALGLSTVAAEARLEDMRLTVTRSFENATRNTVSLPKYRVNPPRKFNWWVRGLYELKANGR